MSINQNFPNVWPSLVLDFENSKTLDPRITFTRSSTATYVGSDGLIKTAAADEARFDHDPTTGESLGLLIEEQRTNEVSNSGATASAQNLTPSFLTVSSVSDVVAPDGTTNGVARYTTSASGSGALRFGTTVGGVIQGIYTASIWIKSATGSDVSMNIDVNDRSTLGFTATTEWKRISTTGFREGSSFPYRFMDVNAGVSKDFYIWGPQVELGAFPTSYIPTSGSTVTRQPDNASITGTNFTDFYNQTEGTIFCSCKINSTSTVRIFNIDDGTDTNRISGLGNVAGYQTFINPAAAGPDVSFPTNSYLKIASGHQDNNIQVYLNSSYQNSNTSITIPKNLNTLRIGNWQFNTFQGTTISQLRYYPERLTDTQLQNLTK